MSGYHGCTCHGCICHGCTSFSRMRSCCHWTSLRWGSSCDRKCLPSLFFLEKLGVDAVACAVSWLNLFVCWSGCCQMLSVGPGMSEPGHVQWRGQGLCKKSSDETGPTLCLNLLTWLSAFFPNSKVQNFNVMFPNLRWTHYRQTTDGAECSFQSGDVPCQWEARLDPDRFLELWLLQEFQKVPESRSELEFQVSCPSCPTFQDSKPEGDDQCQLSQMFAARWIFWLSNWIDCLRNKAVYNWSLQFVLQIDRPIGIAKKKISCNPEGQFCQTCHDQTVTTWCVFWCFLSLPCRKPGLNLFTPRQAWCKPDMLCAVLTSFDWQCIHRCRWQWVVVILLLLTGLAHNRPGTADSQSTDQIV